MPFSRLQPESAGEIMSVRYERTAGRAIEKGMTETVQPRLQADATRHARWVRVCHWAVTVSVFTLAFSGVVILMAHPRLYWGEVGNDLTPALFELPISRNHRHGGWTDRAPFVRNSASAASASRTYDIFNQNGWGRSLHFLSAWVAVAFGAVYLLAGVFTGHFRLHIWPRPGELSPRLLWGELVRHLSLRIPPATGGPQYGLMQKCAYCAVVFAGLPLAVLTGLAMSPAITATYPFLRSMFGGFQSARTVHFFVFVALLLFAIVHIAMVVKSGFKRQIRGMTSGD
jgi:thiosulfate reductase cytochrome b subunit